MKLCVRSLCSFLPVRVRKAFGPAAFLALALAFTPASNVFAKTDPSPDPRFCRALVQHTPSSDVTYQPGIDVHGHAVAAADLNDDSTAAILPEEISIPLTAGLLDFLAVDKTAFPFNTMGRTDILLGTLTLKGDQVFMNGKPLTQTQQDNLAVLCLKPSGDKQKAPLNLKKGK